MHTEVGIEHVNLGENLKLKYILFKKETLYYKVESRFTTESTFLKDMYISRHIIILGNRADNDFHLIYSLC